MNIAIIGYGVVGGGVHALLKEKSLGIRVRKVLDMRAIDSLDGLLTDNIADILGDPQIDCVVEAIGGVHPALSYVTASLRAGKHVVTSNKELVSHALAPLLEGAALHNAQFRFGASVGGGVPWLHNLLRICRAETVSSFYGIVNGTTNYILDAMARGLSFQDALLSAQRKGYAEVDASADLDGLDAQRKCAISASLAFDCIVEADRVPALGIAAIDAADVEAFLARGLACRLLMRARRSEEGVCAYVEPSLLGPDALAAHVPTNHNYISLTGERLGEQAFYGQGAGRYPTALNIVQDLLDIAARLPGPRRAVQPLSIHNEAERHPYYIRTSHVEALAGLEGEKMGQGIMTRPITVATLHALAEEIRKRDPKAFFAGMADV